MVKRFFCKIYLHFTLVFELSAKTSFVRTWEVGKVLNLYLGSGRELRANVVLQNDHHHRISGGTSRFQSPTTFGFRVIDQNVFLGHRGGSKIRNFQNFRTISCWVSI